MTEQHALPTIPAYQPGNRKAMILELTEDEWSKLVTKLLTEDGLRSERRSMVEYIEDILRQSLEDERRPLE